MSEGELEQFQDFVRPLYGATVSHFWQGAGSSVFLEFGTLTHSTRVRRDGSQCNPRGEMGLMIQYDWRIEDETHILTGSSADETEWLRFFDDVLGSQVISLTLFARLPELQMKLSNGLYLCSLMTFDSNPAWAVFDRRNGETKSVGVREGHLHFEDAERER